MASALGKLVDVPIVLWSLAANFYVVSEHESPLTFETEFLLMLDSAPEKGNPGELVDLYYVPWWNETGLKAKHTIMNDTNIGKCLDVYWKQIERMKIPVPSTLVPSAPMLSTLVPSTLVLSPPHTLSSRSADILHKLNITPYTWNKEVEVPDSDSPCRCHLYRSVAMDSLAALHNLQVKVKGMTEVASSLKEDSVKERPCSTNSTRLRS
jgi:hypothetical protein